MWVLNRGRCHQNELPKRKGTGKSRAKKEKGKGDGQKKGKNPRNVTVCS